MKKTRSLNEEYHILFYVRSGLKNMSKSIDGILVLLGILFVLIPGILYRSVSNIFFSLVFLAIGSVLYSELRLNIQMRRGLEKIGFKNDIGEYPYVLKSEVTSETSALEIVSPGIPKEEWDQKKYRIENALDITIFSLYKGDHQDVIVIMYMPGIYDYTATVLWSDVFIDQNEYLALGVNGTGIIRFSFKDTPHMLIGGSSGSGKTWLIKCIIYQCIIFGYDVYLADFKGAVDYDESWEACEILTEMSDFSILMQDLNDICRERMRLIKATAHCSNIDQFNQVSDEKMKRIVVAVDEAADIIETGNDKNLVENLRQIARKGRAVGIHLLICTQRPDATVIPSSIKNNLIFRIAGKCDDNLSRIILDSGDANTEIPKNSSGVFLDSAGNLFKGFYIDESLLTM